MIELIISGHGSFASGITSALEVIMGKQDCYEVIDFQPDDSIDDLRGKFKYMLSKYKEHSEILILVDLFGGSPFNTAMEQTFANKQVHLCYGLSLGALMEVIQARSRNMDIKALTDIFVETSRLVGGVLDVDKLEKFEHAGADEL